MNVKTSEEQVPLLCVCGHPVGYHRTGKRNQYNAYQSRCAYRAAPTDPECPCQLHRDAATYAAIESL